MNRAVFLLQLVFISCQPTVHEKKINDELKEGNSNSIAQSKETIPFLRIPKKDDEASLKMAVRKYCDAYWRQQDSLNNARIPYFENLLKNQILIDSNVSHSNKVFLQHLLTHLKLSTKERYALSAPERPLAPIFAYRSQSAIYGFPATVCSKDGKGYTACKDVTLEHKVLLDKELLQNIYTALTFHKDLLEELVSADKRRIYYYGLNNSGTTEISTFANFQGECLEYYYYGLSNKIPIKASLISSPYSLDLEFVEETRIDSTFKALFRKECFDCSFQYEPEVAFAKFEFIDDLFFTYRDTFNSEKQYDYPARGLVMRLSNKSLVHLWYEEMDLFGCACL